jgi:hypothetical protein
MDAAPRRLSADPPQQHATNSESKAMSRSIFAFSILAAAFLVPVAAQGGNDHEPLLRDLVASKLRSIAADPAVVSAVLAQNAETGGVTPAEIERLDKQWRAETESAEKPLIARTVGNPLSAHLKQVREQAEGVITEIIVMDNKGLNVGVSDVTSDYWQGDEDKWSKTFAVGPDAIFIDEVELDESTQTLQSQVSVSIVDPATNAVIGAITFGVDMEALGG